MTKRLPRLLFALCATTVTSACTGTSPFTHLGSAPSASDTCLAAFQQTGNVMAGKTFRAAQDYPDVSTEQAFSAVAASVVADGWQIIGGDEEAGTISATYGSILGSELPDTSLDITVKDAAPTGSRVEISYSTSYWDVFHPHLVRRGVCKMLSAVTK